MPLLRKTLIAALMLTLSLNLVWAKSFYEDVEDNNPNREAIEFLQQQGIGNESNKFYPRRPVTLAEFITMSLIAAGISTEELGRNRASRFVDVPTEAWFAPYITFADKLGLLTDYRGTMLAPSRTLTRSEALKLGMQIFGIGTPLQMSEEKFGFNDVRSSHRLARQIFYGLKLGLIEPISETEFGTAQRMTREDAATLIYNLAHFEAPGSTTIIIQSGSTNIPNWRLFETVWDEVENRYLFEDKFDKSKMLHSAVRGAINSLDDPYSEFMPPEESEQTSQDLAGEVEGIGVYLGKNDAGELLVISPIKNSPAEKVGLLAGDIITAINGEPTAGLNEGEAAKKIKGPRGTEVKLGILRNGQILEFSIVRDLVQILSVELTYVNNVAVISIAQFASTTETEFAKVVDTLLAGTRPRGIILDLRNDGGGLVNSAVDVLGYFLPKGSLVATAEYRPGLEKENVEYRTSREPTLQNFKLVVLINKGSASASEIVAAALQDYGAATVAGEKSFGKGTVQEVSFFTDGTALKLTVAHWVSPKKQLIQDNGVTPTLAAVDLQETESDEALAIVTSTF